MSLLKQEYDEKMTVKESLLLAVKTLYKFMEINELTSDTMELATLYRKDGETKLHILQPCQVSGLLM